MAKKKKKRELSWWNKLVSKHHLKGRPLVEAVEAAQLDPIYLKKKGLSPPKPKKTRIGRKPPMAKKKEKRKKPKFKLPMAATIGVVAGFITGPKGWASPVEAALNGDAEKFGDALIANYLFYSRPDGKFDLLNKGIGVKLALVGGLISMGASKLGINRRLRDVPFVKV